MQKISMADQLRENVASVRGRIERAALRSGRDPSSVLLVAVTKTLPPERVEEGIRAGLSVFGENRVQEAREKIPKVGLPAAWHLIGNLQSNKAKIAAELFDLIHSVDSVPLAERLDAGRARYPEPGSGRDSGP